MIIETKEKMQPKELFLTGEKPKETEFCLPLPKKSFVLNQYSNPTCVPYSFAMAAMLAVYSKTNKWVVLSPESLRGNIEGNVGGASLWYYAELVCRWGILKRLDFPFVGDNPEMQEKLKEHREKEKNTDFLASMVKGTKWCKLRNFDEVKHALKNGYSVVGSIASNQNTGKYKGGIEPTRLAKVTGSHAICFCGWKQINGKEYLIAINSYGENCGDRGKIYIPRGRMLKDLVAIDVHTKIKPKCKQISFYIGLKKYNADGVLKAFDAEPYIKNNRTYLPVRFVAENLGATVEWDSKNGVATIKSEESNIKISPKINFIEINGKTRELDVAPEIKNGRIMCPVRKIAECLNCEIEWYPNIKKVVIFAL